jgi:hypothetical protein
MTMKAIDKVIKCAKTKALVETYLARRAISEVTRERIDTLYNQALQSFVFCDKITGERFTHHKDTWKVDNLADLEPFYTLCDTLAKENGIKPAGMERDYCPALVAEDNLRKAENELIEYTGKPLGVDNHKLLCSSDGIGNRQNWIDLIVGARLAIDAA